MKKLIIMGILMLWGWFGAEVSSVSAREQVQVAVSIPPQAYFVEQIGGDFVKVITMLPEGVSPHVFEPTATQMKLLSQANMYVRIRVEFENAWWAKFLGVNPEMYVVDSTEGTEFIGSSEHTPEDAGEDVHAVHNTDLSLAGRDPHIWLSPRGVKLQTEAIWKGLMAVDPDHAQSYTRNKNAFFSALDELDRDIQTILAPIQQRTFMVFHPSWAYFARDYHLEQIPIEYEGKEPSAAEMMRLVKLAKQRQIRVIFIQPQTSRRSADIIAKQLGARVELLNPLARNWMENLRQAAQILAESLSE